MLLTNEPDGGFEVEVVGHAEPNFLICRVWNMLALYCRLNDEQSEYYRKAYRGLMDIVFEKNEYVRFFNANPCMAFSPTVCFDEQGTCYLCLVQPSFDNSFQEMQEIVRKVLEIDSLIQTDTECTAYDTRNAAFNYQLVKLLNETREPLVQKEPEQHPDIPCYDKVYVSNITSDEAVAEDIIPGGLHECVCDVRQSTGEESKQKRHSFFPEQYAEVMKYGYYFVQVEERQVDKEGEVNATRQTQIASWSNKKSRRTAN